MGGFGLEAIVTGIKTFGLKKNLQPEIGPVPQTALSAVTGSTMLCP